jgi:adenosylmethionine-8-amino-7-oxononanoate aminotransferase
LKNSDRRGTTATWQVEALSDGLILRAIGDTIIVMPPLSITPAEIKRIFRILLRAIVRITGGGGGGDG